MYLSVSQKFLDDATGFHLLIVWSKFNTIQHLWFSDRHHSKGGSFARCKGLIDIHLVVIAQSRTWKDEVEQVEDCPTHEKSYQECHVVQFDQASRRIRQTSHSNHETTDRGRPSADPCRYSTPVYAFGIPVRSIFGSVKVAKLDSPLAQEVEINYHDAHDWRKEDGERAQYADKSSRLVD